MHPVSMNSKTGAKRATSARTAPSQHGMSLVTWMECTIWMTMLIGRPFRITARYGFPEALPCAGRPIALAIGFGSHHGAGRGWKQSHGVSLHSITAAGRSSEDIGAGSLARSWFAQYTLPRLSDSSAGAA